MTSLSITPFPFPKSSLMIRPSHTDAVMNSLVKDFFDDNWDVTHLDNPSQVAPLALDVKETETFYELLVDAPGIDKDNTKIEIENHILTISVEKKKTDITETEKMKRVERSYGKSARSLKLGEESAKSAVKEESKSESESHSSEKGKEPEKKDADKKEADKREGEKSKETEKGSERSKEKSSSKSSEREKDKSDEKVSEKSSSKKHSSSEKE